MTLALLATVLVPPLAQWGDGHHGDGWGIVMWLGMIVFWGGVIVLIVWLVRDGAGARQQAPHRESPLDVLHHRLAAGEISVEEYERRLAALRGDEAASRREQPSPQGPPDSA